ncbi:hypothetical protein EJB05_07030 [Eragrostis curvula]|uniref:Upf1 domain-containing protein n=1 Tax=Eragrostis curvula TaxID=38414 RepID=A0A5J9WHS6_9POAL|nr:hypothetical protein EJB05_07030 [Eragrostis curvula]
MEDKPPAPFPPLTADPAHPAGDPSASGSSVRMLSPAGSPSAASRSPTRMPDPKPACQYCGINNPACMARCNYPTCHKWFCNTPGSNTLSHIVKHLVHFGHKEWNLHEDNPLGDEVLECCYCNCKNILALGFAPLNEEKTIALACYSCAMSMLGEKPADMEWHPIVDNGSFLPWLVEVPSKEDHHQVNDEEIKELEVLWEDNHDLFGENLHDDVQPVMAKSAVPTDFYSCLQYQQIFSQLINFEGAYSKVMNESVSKESIDISWCMGRNYKWVAYFEWPKEDTRPRLLMGDIVRLRHSRENSSASIWQALGHVINLKHGMVAVELHENKEVAHQLKLTLLPRNFGVPGVPKLKLLNNSQFLAVTSALQRPLSLIQGIPGTGRSITAAAIIYHIVQSRNGKVLVCAPTAHDVDKLTGLIQSIGLKVVMLCSRYRESIAHSIQCLTLQYKVLKSCTSEEGELNNLRVKDEQGTLSLNDMQRYEHLRERDRENEIIMKGEQGSSVLIYDSTHATEPECLIPIVHGAEKVPSNKLF